MRQGREYFIRVAAHSSQPRSTVSIISINLSFVGPDQDPLLKHCTMLVEIIRQCLVSPYLADLRAPPKHPSKDGVVFELECVLVTAATGVSNMTTAIAPKSVLMDEVVPADASIDLDSVDFMNFQNKSQCLEYRETC